MRVLVDDVRFFDPGARLEAGDRELVVVHSRPHKNTLLVGFADVTSRNDAEDLQGVELMVRGAERRELDSGEFWPEDLIGLAVHVDGDRLGEVVGVVEGSAQDRLIIETVAGETIEVPFVDELVPEVLPEQGKIRVAPIEGLF